MAQVEFRKLRRLELVDIIYRLQEDLEEQTKENEKLKRRLEDRELRIEKAGSIAQAAAELNGLMEAAQKTVDQYRVSVEGSLWRREMEARQQTAQAAIKAEETKRKAEKKAGEILQEAGDQAEENLQEARNQAKEILQEARNQAEEILWQARDPEKEIPRETGNRTEEVPSQEKEHMTEITGQWEGDSDEEK
ncbi:MAG TPA: hypothetical protein H9914_02750 [Candidatus Blautia avicola]|uniref:Uncharacterized protein n=1 Tax=Candidatus Blautia avicola TaxID=2838483 RepID=A0A9D2QSG7_9FIRM|nr:hypothetical protein [Candidatus Blautia avicola]